MTNVYPLIICGGNGTRLWPISRSQSPKQFQKIGGPDSPTFFQSALQRHRSALYQAPIVVTGQIHRGTVTQQLRDVQMKARVICEPKGRNTGPAVLAAAHSILADDADAILVVIPADHVIEGDLDSAVAARIGAAEAGRIITFGITPRHAETGFGYIVDGGSIEGDPSVREVSRFVEKPPREIAEELVATGNAYWASGISMFRADTIITEYDRFDPATTECVRRAVAEGRTEGGALLLAPEPFNAAHSAPTESRVFEHTDRIALATLDVEWNDVGSWVAMYEIQNADHDGNVFQGDVIALDSRNTMVRADSRLVSVVGLSDVIVIDTDDALLVARMSDSQNVKTIVEELKRTQRAEAERHAQAKAQMVPISRPSGLEKLVTTDRFDLGTAQIEVGQSIHLDPGIGRQAIVVRGEVHACGTGWSKEVREGGRVYSDPLELVRITNISDMPTELLFVTLDTVEDRAPVIPIASNG